MKVVTVGSFKGGAGKTTTALLMAQLWRYKYSIAIIDLNPMPQGRDWAIAVGLHAGHLPNAGASELHAAIRSLHFDLVIIDAPPATDAAVGAAVAFSDVVLIPFRPSEWEFAGLEVLTMSIVHTIERKQVPPRIIGIPSRDDPRRKKARFSPPPCHLNSFTPLRSTDGPSLSTPHPPMEIFIRPSRSQSRNRKFTHAANSLSKTLSFEVAVMQKPANHKGVDISDVLKGASEILGHAEDPYPVKMTVRFTELQHEALRKEAFRSRQAISEIVRKLIDAHIVRTPKG